MSADWAAEIQRQATALLVGRTEGEAVTLAAERDWTVRVVSIDGHPLMVTCDVRNDRVNVHLVEGVVTAVAVG